MLETIRPDVVHFQHFVFLGIDFLTLTRTTLPDCRIVFSFKEFIPICAVQGHMVRTTDGSLCTQPSPVRCHQCLPGLTPDYFVMRKMWFMRHLSVVDCYACASRFPFERYAAWGLDRSKMVQVRNGQLNRAPSILPPAPEGPKTRFGFFGQYVDAKGLHVVLRAVQTLRSEGFTDFTIELNGDNLRFATPAIREEIETFLAAEEQRPPAERNVVDNGSYEVDNLAERMLRIDWSLVPSVWWEMFGNVISEAWMFKRPVICSNVGGMAERIAHDVTGLHFQVGDPRSLAAAIHRACTEPGLWERLSEATPEPPSRQEAVKGYRALYEEA